MKKQFSMSTGFPEHRVHTLYNGKTWITGTSMSAHSISVLAKRVINRVAGMTIGGEVCS